MFTLICDIFIICFVLSEIFSLVEEKEYSRSLFPSAARLRHHPPLLLRLRHHSPLQLLLLKISFTNYSYCGCCCCCWWFLSLIIRIVFVFVIFFLELSLIIRFALGLGLGLGLGWLNNSQTSTHWRYHECTCHYLLDMNSLSFLLYWYTTRKYFK